MTTRCVYTFEEADPERRRAPRRQGRRTGPHDAGRACPSRPASSSPPGLPPTIWRDRETARRPGRRGRCAHRSPTSSSGRAETFGGGPVPLLCRCVRGPRLDARDDGHDPQPRARPRGGRRPRRGHAATPRSWPTLTALPRDVLRDRPRGPIPTSATGVADLCAARRRDAAPRCSTGYWAALPAGRGGRRRRGGAGGPRAQLRGAVRRSSLVEHAPARDDLPGAARHPARPGHRRRRPVHGVRQPRLADPGPASSSPATPSPASPRSSASSSSAGRARTWWPALRTPEPDRRGRRAKPGGVRRARRDLAGTSSAPTATSSTSSSPSNAASCTCCRCAAPSGPRRPRCGSPPTCCREGGSGRAAVAG